MKDKEKQIQEIAQIICGRSKDDICIIDNTSCDSSCCWARKAEAIYNVGYRKHPKDSIVLSREEYDTLKTENDKYVKNCIDYIATINKLENKVWEVEQQASKETAEKILTILHPYIGGWVLFKELEKEYGVKIEIKE